MRTVQVTGPDTDIYLDAAGAPIVIQQVTELACQGATLGIVAVHKKPVEVDFGGLLTTERTIVWAMGYPTEIFEVTDDIVENWEKYQVIMGGVFPYERARGPGSRTHAGCNRQGCGADFLGPRVGSLSRRASACAARRP